MEGNSSDQTIRLKNTLEQIAEVVCYENLTSFIKNIGNHTRDIVFPMFYGVAGYNAKGIVPSICEAYGVNYVGGDAYTQLLCNNKSLSKLYAKQFGICSPNGCILRQKANADVLRADLKNLEPPLVVKPNLGGGSTGISINSIVNEYQEAIDLACVLLERINVPILIEEYISGYEVELIIVGTQKKITFCEEVQVLMNDNAYFEHELWGFEAKSIDDSIIDFAKSNYILQDERNKLINMFKSFDKIEYARFDGRIHNGHFYGSILNIGVE